METIIRVRVNDYTKIRPGQVQEISKEASESGVALFWSFPLDVSTSYQLKLSAEDGIDYEFTDEPEECHVEAKGDVETLQVVLSTVLQDSQETASQLEDAAPVAPPAGEDQSEQGEQAEPGE